MVGLFEKALGAVKVIKDQIQYRSQSLLNLARDYFSIKKVIFGSLSYPVLPWQRVCQGVLEILKVLKSKI